MNEIENTIAQLERYNSCNSFSIESENVNLAIQALQEKLSREQACEGCKYHNRHQKCSCCRRNKGMKDNYEI